MLLSWSPTYLEREVIITDGIAVLSNLLKQLIPGASALLDAKTESLCTVTGRHA